MAKPASRQELIDYCLRALGSPVIEINVDDDQVEDRIDEAIQFYQEYHSDAVVRKFLKHQVTEDDITNRYIDLPESLLFVNRIFPIGGIGAQSGIFNIQYQMHINDLFGLRNPGDLVNYAMTRQYMSLIEMEINGMSQQTTFSRHRNRLYIEMDWANKIKAGEYLIVEGYETLNPDTYTDVYNDMLLKRYATALIKKQWGANLIKFAGLQLPGGVTLDGRQIYDDAINDINAIEEKMQSSYEMPPDFFIG